MLVAAETQKIIIPHTLKVDVPESCTNRQRTKFWLTSRLRLSWKVVDESLRLLANGKLIEANKRRSETTRYKTTAKGQEALNAYKLLVEKYFSL